MTLCHRCIQEGVSAEPSEGLLSEQQRHAFNGLVPNAFKKLPKLPKRVRLAREKHAHDNLPTPTRPTLADRFYALPGELRNNIFALLLVQPVRWAIPHDLDCQLRAPTDVGSEDDIPPKPDWTKYTCIRCTQYNWRTPHCGVHLKIGWMNPWRSKYAPTPTNRMMCSDCWDEHFRPRPCPPRPPRQVTDQRFGEDGISQDGIPCLCARRTELDVLLVCRRWYGEAGYVFYTRNTFAFEDATAFVDFAENLDPRWKDQVRRVSVMTIPQDEWKDENDNEIGHEWETNRALADMFKQLHQFSGLSYLELDALYLTRPRNVRCMLKLGLRDRRLSVCFARRQKENLSPVGGVRFVWPHCSRPQLLTGGFPEVVARAIKGQPFRWSKKAGVIERLVESYSVLCAPRRLNRNDKDTVETRNDNSDILDCSDLSEWESLWYASANASIYPHKHAFLSKARYVTREGHWRDWELSVSTIEESAQQEQDETAAQQDIDSVALVSTDSLTQIKVYA